MENTLQPSIYKSPLSPNFWREATGELQSIKKIILCAVFVALTMAIGRFFIPIPVMGGQRIYFTFFVKALGTVIYGPVVGGIASAVGDIIGALLFPTGPFFIGYTISAFLGTFIYGLFFYRQKITIFKIFMAKFTVNIFVNIFLGSLWIYLMNRESKLFWPLVIARAPKNIILLPIEVLVMYLFFSMIIPIMRKMKVIDYAPFDGKINWF